MPKPTASSIELLRTHLNGLWNDTHIHWEMIDSYYHRDFALWPEEEIDDKPSYHPSTPTAIIDHAVDNQLAHRPRFRRFAADETERAKRRADQIEPFLDSVFEEAALLEPSLTWKQVGKNLLTYGYAIIEGPMLDSTEKPKKPRRSKGEDSDDFEMRNIIYENEKRTWNPFRIRAPHPSHVLLDPMTKRPKEGVKVQMRYAIELQRLTEARADKDGNARRKNATVKVWDAGDDHYTEVATLEYWSMEWHAMVADSKLLFVEPNTWKLMPWKHAFAGFGQLRTNDKGVMTRTLALGLLDPVLESLRIDAQARSAVHNALMETAFADRITDGDAENYRNQKAQGSGIIQVPEGKTITWEEPPSLNRWVLEGQRMVDDDIQFGTYNRSLAGQNQTGVYHVGQQAILTNSAEKKFIATGKQMEYMATLVGQDILKLVDVLGEPITVRGNTVRPTDIDHDYSIEALFEIVDPALELQKRQVAMSEVAAGLKSSQTFMEEGRMENVSKERRRLLEDLLRRDPQVQQILIQELSRQLGLVQLAEQVGDSTTNEQPGGGGEPVRQPLTDSVQTAPQGFQDFTGTGGQGNA